MESTVSTFTPYYGWTIVAISSILFHFCSVCVSKCFTPNCVHLASKGQWRWKNICVSLIHSLLSGVCSVLCFYHDPRLASDILTYYNMPAYYLTCVSIGYFVYDTLDLMRFHRSRQSYELLLHHLLIILCFGITITINHYVAYAVVALTIEVNSIFLHIRQLMQILKVQKTNPTYRLNSLLNLATYIVIRIGVLAWMTRWIVVNRDSIPLVLYAVGSSGLAVMTVINIVLLLRLLQSDFVSKKEQHKCD